MINKLTDLDDCLEFSERDLKLLEDFVDKNIQFSDEREHIPLFERDGSRASFIRNYKGVCQDPEISLSLAKFFIHKFKKEIKEGGLVLVATPTPGVSIAAQLSSIIYFTLGIKVPLFLVRERRKKYGTSPLVDGDLKIFNKNKHLIVLVDDVINSGASVKKTLFTFLHEQGLDEGEVQFAGFCLFSYSKNLNFRIESPVNKQDRSVVFSEFHAKKRNPHAGFKKIEKKNVLWSFKSQTTNTWGVPKGRPILQENLGQILINSDQKGVICLDINNGIEKWNVKTTSASKGVVSSPCALDNNYIVYGDYGGNLNFVNFRSGKLEASQNVCDWIGSSPCMSSQDSLWIGLEYNSSQKPGSIANFILEAELDESYNLNFSFKKKSEIFLTKYQHSSPSFWKEGEAIITGTNSGYIISIDCETGKELWRTKIGSAMKSSPTIDSEIFIIGAFDGNIYIGENESGKILHQITTKDIVYSKPLIENKICYFGSADGNFFTFSISDPKNIKILNSFFSGGKIHCEPTMNKEKIYFGNNNGILCEIDKNGKPENFFYIGERLVNRIAIDKEDNFYVLNNLNEMLKLKIK